MTYAEFIELQVAMQSQLRRLLWSVSITNGKRVQFLNRDLSAHISIWNCIVLQERPSALLQARLRFDCLVCSVGIVLECCGLSMKNIMYHQSGD